MNEETNVVQMRPMTTMAARAKARRLLTAIMSDDAAKVREIMATTEPGERWVLDVMFSRAAKCVNLHRQTMDTGSRAFAPLADFYATGSDHHDARISNIDALRPAQSRRP